MEDFVAAMFYCPHALADGNKHTLIREKMLEFSSGVSPNTTFGFLLPSVLFKPPSAMLKTSGNTATLFWIGPRFSLQPGPQAHPVIK